MYKKLAGYACFLILGLALSYAERFIPMDLAIPGVKLGLGNLVMVLLLFRKDPAGAALINLGRILLSGLLFGNLFGTLYGLCGGACAFLVMWGGTKLPQIGPVGCSILGGMAHNLGQFLAAGLLLQFAVLRPYLPFLLLSGTVTGCLIGMAAGLLLPRLQKIRSWGN